MQLIPAGKNHVADLTQMSKRAFDSDVEVGAVEAGGPPDYDSLYWHEKMRRKGHLFEALEEGKSVGGAVLFLHPTGSMLYVGRIFLDDGFRGHGLGLELMRCVEKLYPQVTEIYLDTPIWNTRTNSFYPKLGYVEQKRDNEFIYYMKQV